MSALTMNEWFVSLSAGRQAALAANKWSLAEAAFEAGAAAAGIERRAIKTTSCPGCAGTGRLGLTQDRQCTLCVGTGQYQVG
jgi:DnaJ-class molecular chaperone